MAVGITFSTFTHFSNEIQWFPQKTLLVLDLLQKVPHAGTPYEHLTLWISFCIYFSNGFTLLLNRSLLWLCEASRSCIFNNTNQAVLITSRCAISFWEFKNTVWSNMLFTRYFCVAALQIIPDRFVRTFEKCCCECVTQLAPPRCANHVVHCAP